ncbi:DUF2264 domain-containing protein [Agromyces sp. MMS24-K17]|uniref:DUF2264 domain-containing protein n=1 Tax=Agromyces sp. MMS24-K17 TaxID=3372850 RepID=UPI00375405E1
MSAAAAGLDLRAARGGASADPLAPITGWGRADWLALADRMLDAGAAVNSPRHALLRFPGTPGGYGADVDALEGFARTWMLASFRIAGDPERTGALAARYAEGFDAGTDPASPERWLRPDEVDQAKVEAAALAIGLHLTRDVVWANLAPRVQANIVDYLSAMIGATYPPNNWAWFRIVSQQFLASVGADHSRDDIEADLDLLDGFFREGGWIADGASRSFDHYTGWALHLYPVIWESMLPADDPFRARLPKYRAALDAFLPDAAALVGADGGPLVQGRSLTYRFAAAAPFWAGALAGSTALEPGVLRRAASGVVSHFADRGAPDADGRLSLGWHHAWRPIAQNYSGTGSPYWAAKGMLGIALPESHPVWQAEELPLPVERGDLVRRIAAPGWLVSGTSADGIVRVVNHGTDHAHEGDLQTDAPLYTRLGYSTATAPLLAGPDASLHPDQAVAIVVDGVPSARTGFTVEPVDVVDGDGAGLEARGSAGATGATGAVVAASTAVAHWVDDVPPHPDHGHPLPGGTVRRGPLVTVVSVVRGPWEVRLVRVAPGGDGEHVDALPAGASLRVSGWPVSGDAVDREVGDHAASATARGIRSRLVDLGGFAEAGVRESEDATFLGPRTATPWLAAALESTLDDATDAAPAWRAAAVELSGDAVRVAVPSVRTAGDGTASVAWGDGTTTSVGLPGPR